MGLLDLRRGLGAGEQLVTQLQGWLVKTLPPGLHPPPIWLPSLGLLLSPVPTWGGVPCQTLAWPAPCPRCPLGLWRLLFSAVLNPLPPAGSLRAPGLSWESCWGRCPGERRSGLFPGLFVLEGSLSLPPVLQAKPSPPLQAGARLPGPHWAGRPRGRFSASGPGARSGGGRRGQSGLAAWAEEQTALPCLLSSWAGDPRRSGSWRLPAPGGRE